MPPFTARLRGNWVTFGISKIPHCLREFVDVGVSKEAQIGIEFDIRFLAERYLTFMTCFRPHSKGRLYTRTLVMRACCHAHKNKVLRMQGSDRNEPVRRVGDDTQKLQVPATYNHGLICVFLVFSSPFASWLSIAALFGLSFIHLFICFACCQMDSTANGSLQLVCVF